MSENVLGKRLRKLREKRGLSQKEAAKRFGISNFALSRYENGTANPDPDLIAKFSEFYDVSSDYILGRTDNPAGVIREDGSETDVYQMLMENDKSLTLNGKPLTDEQKEILSIVMEKLAEADEDEEKFLARLLRRLLAGESAREIKKDINK
ncbi:hypothetical protein GCM10010965_12520 [Caldalkalibacillus thermarum]|uniref:helix-turn-helix domain-containing protein n=1 Tax=Caldalkalibacillus thermarum TaxID=296745 RepID=UPI0016675D0B|nr:helix-turn-helix transcriptional regulator [Caldalkalibacillus thermarum]GGK20920.1 hypothetical protein GCM10010965_12520 [Caldalkalibacillus thermarum]